MQFISRIFDNALSNPTVAICRTAQVAGGAGAVAAIVIGYLSHGERVVENPNGVTLDQLNELKGRVDSSLKPARTLLVGSLILLALGTAFLPKFGPRSIALPAVA